MSAPLSITSPSHPEAVGLSLLYVVLGFLVASDRFPARALAKLIGPDLMPWWGALLMLAGVVCAASLIVAPWLRVPSAALWVEMGSRLPIIAMLALYAWSISYSGAPFTLACFLAFPIAGLVRCGQIVREQSHLRAALATPRTTEVTADPRDDG